MLEHRANRRKISAFRRVIDLQSLIALRVLR